MLVAFGCAPARDGASTDSATALPAIDTLKVATDSMPRRDSVAVNPGQTPTPIVGIKTGTKTPPPNTTKTKTGRDSIIGYDKATPLNPNNKLLDTVRKRPPR